MRHKLFLAQAVERETPFERKVEVAVIRGVTEVTGGDDVLRVVPFRMSFGKEMVPRKREPSIE